MRRGVWLKSGRFFRILPSRILPYGQIRVFDDFLETQVTEGRAFT